MALYRTVMIDREAIRQRWRLFGSQLDERGRRHFAAVEARTAGRGGIVAVHEITGWPAAIAAATLALMCSNWALRSGWLAPSCVLRLTCRE